MSLIKSVYRNVKKGTVDKLYNRYVSLNQNNRSFISFTFDDFPKSASAVGLPILERYQIKATFYVALQYENQRRYNKKMFNFPDLDAIFDAGHEIGGHTYNHIDCRSEPYRHIKDSIELNKRKLSEIFPGLETVSFAYPKGMNGMGSRRLINKYFKSARTTASGINHGITNLNLLKANKLYSNSVDAGKCFKLIDKNKRNNGWLIFYTHDVENTPSDYGCTPDFFKQIIEYSLKADSEILPVRSVLERLPGSANQ